MLYLILPGSSCAKWRISRHLVSLVLCSEAIILWLSQEFPGGMDWAVICTWSAWLLHQTPAVCSSFFLSSSSNQAAESQLLYWHYMYVINQISVFRCRNPVLTIIHFCVVLQNNLSQIQIPARRGQPDPMLYSSDVLNLGIQSSAGISIGVTCCEINNWMLWRIGISFKLKQIQKWT